MKNFTQFLVVKGLQPVTVRGHVSSMGRIIRKIETENITCQQANDFVSNLYMSNVSYSHKSNQVKALEYWLEYKGNKMIFGRQRKPKRLFKETLTEAEITRMIISTKNIKEKSIVILLAYSGVRPKELCQIKISDIDFGTNQLRIEQGKEFKDGIIYIPSECIKCLMEYVIKDKLNSNDFLFKTYMGNQYNQNALRKTIKVISKRAKIEKRVYPYLLRHSLATNMVKRGANILYIKEHFRHAWIETTMLYIHSIGNLDRVEQYFPQYI